MQSNTGELIFIFNKKIERLIETFLIRLIPSIGRTDYYFLIPQESRGGLVRSYNFNIMQWNQSSGV